MVAIAQMGILIGFAEGEGRGKGIGKGEEFLNFDLKQNRTK